MRECYYGRHGETYDLVAGRRSRFDTALTEQGRAEMRRAGRLLRVRGIRPSLIVCSTIPRAIHSAEIVAAEIAYDKRIQRQPLFNERNCGVVEGMFNTKIGIQWPGGYDTVPSAESLEELQARAAKGVAWLKELEHEMVLVIAHGTLGRAVVRAFEGRPHTDEYAHDQVKFGRGQIKRLFPLPTTALV